MKALINHHTNLTTFVSNWYNPNCKTTMICSIICMSDIMCNVLALSGVDRGIDPLSSQAKTYEILIFGFFAKYAALKSKSNDLFVQNQNNVTVEQRVYRCVMLLLQ